MLRTDGNGRIYIFDVASQTVAIFDSTSRFVRRIGRRGMGPGEYDRVTAFAVSRDGSSIATFDANGSRLAILDSSGSVVNTSVLNQSGTIRWLSFLDDSTLVALGRSQGREEFLFTIDSEGVVVQARGAYSLAYPSPEVPVTESYTRSSDGIGKLLVDNRRVFFCPGLFDGRFFEYPGSPGTDSVHTLWGHGPSRRAIEAVDTEGRDINDLDDIDYDVATTGAGAARIFGSCHGLFRSARGTLLLFATIGRKSEAQRLVQVFDPSTNELLDTYRLDFAGFPGKMELPPLHRLLWLDSKDRAFFRSRTPFPHVVIAQLSIPKTVSV